MKKFHCLIAFLGCISWFLAADNICLAQDSITVANEHLVINAQIERLKSSAVETRREAVHQLLILENAVASRAAVSALRDKSEIIRATAAKACAILPGDEAAFHLTPILVRDKSEFVRREAVFALGQAWSQAAVLSLIQVLQKDKKLSVRAAAAIALGKIADARSVAPLSTVLLAKRPKKKKTLTELEFVKRSAARALGETRLKSAVPALIASLQNAANADDIRREAAFALGLIADKAAIPALTENLQAADYILAETAKNALQRIENSVVIHSN